MPEIDVDHFLKDFEKQHYTRRLAEIKQTLCELGDIIDLGLEKFLSDSYVRDAAKYIS